MDLPQTPGVPPPAPRPVRLFLVSLGVTLLLSLPVFLAPAPGSVLLIFAPVPIAVASLLGSMGLGAAVALCAAAAAGMVAGSWGASLASFLEIGVAGLTVAFCLRRRLPWLATVVSVAGIQLLAQTLAALLTAPGGLWSIAAAGQVELGRAEGLLREYLGEGDAPFQVERFREAFTLLFPGLLAVGALMNALLASLLASRLTAGTSPAPGPFGEWRLPDHLVWVFIVAAFALLRDPASFRGLPAGILVALGFLYLLQGVAVALTLADRRGIPLWVRFVAGVAVLLQPLFLAVFLVVGLLDFRFDFRKPKSP